MFQSFVRLLHARNPFYLLSAVSMLLGCYALSHALGLEAGQWEPVASLIGVLQVYELVLLGLAVFLLRHGMSRDARTAFLLGLLFVADATYLNTEIAAASPWIAPWIALAHLAFLIPKILVLRDALGLTSLRTLAVTVAQVSVLVFIPATFSGIHLMDSNVYALGLGRAMLPLVAYGLWWLVGAIPIVYLWADRASEHGDAFAALVSRVSLVLPFGSILLHLFTLHWMYSLPLYGSYLTPLALGIATNVVYTFARDHRAGRLFLQWATPAVAVVLSAGYPETLVFTVGPSFIVTPFRMAFVAIAVVFWIHRRLSDQPVFTWASVAALGVSLSGPSFTAMRVRWVNVFPETLAEVGIAFVIGAFALLALGLAFSLGRAGDGDSTHVSRGGPPRYAE